MKTVYLSLGSNIGDRLGQLREAVRIIAEREDVQVAKISSVYETEPIGGVDQESFYNIVVEIETSLPPKDVLQLAHDVEKALRRERKVHWGPRTIDIDILLYDEILFDEKDLVIPHPEMKNRAFVLAPLLEIAPEIRFPDGTSARHYMKDVAKQGIEKVGSLI